MRSNSILRTTASVIFAAAFLASSFTATPELKAEMVDKVIAVVNDEAITKREFERAYKPIKQQYEERFKGEELKRRLEAAEQGLLEDMINSKLATSIAKKRDIEIDEEELQNRVDKIRSFYPTKEAFLKALDSKGTNLTEFKQEMRDQMLAQKLIEKEVASTINITPVELRELYKENKGQMVSPLRVKLRSILVRKDEGDTSKEEIQKTLDKIQAELENGTAFSEVAEESSEGPYASEGGNMGYVVQGQLLPEIDEAVFQLDNGEVSDVITTRVGYHIFKVEDVQQPEQLKFEEVSDFLREQLYMKRYQEKMQEWIKEQRENAYISYK